MMRRTSSLDNPTQSDRLLRVHRRLDLAVQPQKLRSGIVWAVKDPLSHHYFHLTEESWWILSQLDGTARVKELQTSYERRFPPQTLTLRELEACLAKFHRQALIVSNSPDQDVELLSLARKSRRNEFWQTLLNPLSIRLKGIDPDRWLVRLRPATAWLWHPFSIFCGALWILSAVLLALSHIDEIVRRIGDSSPYLAGAGLLLLPLALVVSKVLHELGHAFVCRHMGAECHELGILFLIFTPCLYCDVSDAWMLPGKWQRAAVGVAGVWIDLLIAATAGWLWWFSQPGAFQALCGSLVVVCSVATLAFNANPLMRYDGYYVLSDLLEIPNLSQRADAALADSFSRFFGRDTLKSQRTGWLEHAGLAAYACASLVWRVFLVFAVLWLVARALAPFGLEPLAGLLAVLVFAGMAAGPIRRLSHWMKAPGDGAARPWRRIGVAAALLTVCAAAISIPWPHTERTLAIVEPAGSSSVYVSMPGIVVRTLRPGTVVAKGDEIAVLENLELLLEIDRLKSELARQKLRLENLQRRQGGDPQAAAEIPTTEEAILAVESRLERRREEERRLVLLSPQDGVVLPPPDKPRRSDEESLRTWEGSPLDPRNAGSFLETGTLVCQVGNPRALEARLLIDQNQMEFVEPGQRVRILLDQRPWESLKGRIVEISQVELKAVPPALAQHVELPVRVDERGVARPASTVYQAKVEFDPHSAELLLRQTGRARIQTAGLSLWRRMQRLFGETFGLDGWRRP